MPEVPLQVLEKNPPEVDVNAEDVAKQEFQNKMAELQDVNVKPITFAVPVSDRRETTVINAVASLYTRFRALQVPIYRVRVDRAKELVSQRFRTWASARNLEVRVSPGDEPTQNSTAEIGIQVLKNVTRTLLQSSGLDVSFWPLALRQAAEQRSRRQLSVLGLQLWCLGCGSQKDVGQQRSSSEVSEATCEDSWSFGGHVTNIRRVLGGG